MSEFDKPEKKVSDVGDFGTPSHDDFLALFELIVKQTSDGVLITSIDPATPGSVNIVYANPSFFQLTGYSSSEILGTHSYKKIIFLNELKKTSKIYAALASTAAYEENLKLTRKSGEPYWAKINLSTVNKGTVFYRIHSYRELTYEILLKESLQKYKSLFDNHPDGVFALDRKGLITATNKSGERITGFTKSDLYKMPLDSLITEQNLIDARQAFEKALKGITKTVEIAIKNRNEKIITGTLTEIPIYIDNEVRGVYGIAHDISQANYLSKILNLEKKVLENIVGGGDLKPTLDDFLSEIESLYPSIYLTIMLTDAKEQYLEFYAGQSLPPTFLAHLRKIPIGNDGGACGTSAYLKEVTIVPDVEKSDLMKNYWRVLKDFGFKACWSYPILSSKGAVLGTFALYKKRKGFPDKKLEKILQREGNIISLLIENKQGELAYRQLNERFKLAMDASNEAIWDWDIKNNSLMWGSGFEKIFGYPLEKATVTLEWWSVNLHPDEKEFVINSLNAALTSKSNYWSSEYRYKASDGNYRFVLDRGTIIRDKKNKAQRMVGAMIDLTERKLAEETILESEEQYRSLADSTMEGIVIYRTGEILDFNKAFSVMIGYEDNKEELIGKSLSDFLYEEEQEKVKSFIDGGNSDFFEISGFKVANESFPVEIRAVDSIYKGKNAKIVSFRNIFERKKIEKELMNYSSELARSNAELEQFAYMASHDLQEPLRMVTSFLQLLKRKYGEGLDEQANQYIDIAVDGAERMKILIKDLLNFSKISFQNEEMEAVDLNVLLEEVRKTYSDKLAHEDGEIKVDVLPVLEGHKALFSQLFQNLIGNALKYKGKEAPSVKVSVSEDTNNWEFIVSDNGIGIEEQFLEKVFVVFLRLHTRDEYQGTGIGLAICKKIVEKYGGIIWVESTPGVGSDFHFTIPKTFH